MANPTKYDPDYSFSGFQASNPSKPLPAASLDNELANVSQSIDETIDALAEVRRSDGALANGIVTPDSLSDAARLEFSRLATGVSPAIQAEAEAGVNVTEYMSPATTKAAITFRVGATVLTPSFNETPDADNTAEFEAALTAVASGGRLFIPAGVWMVDGNHEVPSNVEILGPGTLKLRVDAEIEVLDLTGSSNVYLHQFKIDGNASIVTGATARQSRAPAIRINAVGDGNLADNTRIEGLEIFNTHGPGILAAGLTNSRIVNNHIHDTGGRGIQGGSNYDNVLIFDNHIHDTYLGGIGVNGQGTMAAPVGTSRMVQVIANRVHDAQHDPLNESSGIGIEVIGNVSGTIFGNIVHDCGSMGISTGYTADLAVVGNQVADIAYSAGGGGQGFGIEASFVSRSSIVGNTVKGCRVGLYVTSGEGDTIAGNTITNDVATAYPGDESYTRQIWLRSATNADPLAFGFGGPCEGHIISGNSLNGGHVGVFIGNPSVTYDAVRDIQISSNTFRDHVDAIRSIGIGTMEDISVAGNAIVDVYVTGVLLSTVTRPSVRGNRFQGQRNAGAAGVNFTGCSDPTMVGNEFRGLTGVAGAHTSSTGTALIAGNVKDASVGAFDSNTTGYTLVHARGNGHYDPLWVRDTAANATWTLSAYEDVILVNTALSAAGVTVFSSTAARYKGKVVTIKDKGGQASTKNITFDGNGFAVDGGTTAIISTDYGSLRVFSDGVKWWVV